MTALIRIMNHELRIMIFVLFMILASIFMIHPAYAQTSTSSAIPLPSYVSPTSPIYTDLLVNNLFHSFSCIAIGQSVIGQPCLTYQMTKNAQGMIQRVPMLAQVNTTGGTLSAVTSVIDLMYANPPIRTADYLASVGQGLGIVKEAHAQVTGSGAQVLNPILNLWQVSRNISYVLMIIIFLVIGLMVMFRNKINPQTVITAQAALPGLVIGLIMITFSYFFASLITDTAFIGTNLIGAYFSAAQGGGPSNLTEDLKEKNVLSIMSTFIGSAGIPDLNPAVSSIITQLGPGPGTIISAVASFLSYTYAYQFGDLPATGIAGGYCGISSAIGILNPVSEVTGNAAVVSGVFPSCVKDATLVAKTVIAGGAAFLAATSPASVISMALYVILIAVLLYTMFKLLLRLVSCFLTIIFLTVTAPFHFLFASLPGRQGLATGWMLDMLGNILAFPAIIAVFYFVNYLLGSHIQGIGTTTPPFPVTGDPLNLSGDGALPLFGNLNIGFIRMMMAVGALMATPSIPDIISKAIGRVSQAGQMIGQELGGGMRSGQGYIGQARQGIGGIQTGGLYNKPGYTYDADGNLIRITNLKQAEGLAGSEAGGRTLLAQSGWQAGTGEKIKAFFNRK